MNILTCMSVAQLAELVSKKRVTLDNKDVFFKPSSDIMDEFFKTLVGGDGYILGLRGRRLTADVLKIFEKWVDDPEGTVVLEANINPEAIVEMELNSIDKAAEAAYYNFSDAEVLQILNDSITTDTGSKRVKLICIPELTSDARIKVAPIDSTLELTVQVDNIDVLHLKGGKD